MREFNDLFLKLPHLRQSRMDQPFQVTVNHQLRKLFTISHIIILPLNYWYLSSWPRRLSPRYLLVATLSLRVPFQNDKLPNHCANRLQGSVETERPWLWANVITLEKFNETTDGTKNNNIWHEIAATKNLNVRFWKQSTNTFRTVVMTSTLP